MLLSVFSAQVGCVQVWYGLETVVLRLAPLTRWLADCPHCPPVPPLLSLQQSAAHGFSCKQACGAAAASWNQPEACQFSWI